MCLVRVRVRVRVCLLRAPPPFPPSSPQSPLMLRKLLPRGKIIILLRDTVERAYVDLVRTIAGAKSDEAEDSLVALTHGCMRVVSSPDTSISIDSWETKKADEFKSCINAGKKDLDVSDLSCIAATVGPAGELDWGVSFSTFALTNKMKLAPAGNNGAAAMTAGTPLNAEAVAWMNKGIRQVERRILVGCVTPSALGRDPLADLAAVTPEEISAAFEQGAEVIDSCSQLIEPGVSLPVPVDLMAGVVAGYDLNLVAVSADMPKESTMAGKVITDGEDKCFPGGVEGFGKNSPAHALARSMYLRPLQRIQAAFGRDTVSILESSTIKSRPLSVFDPILTDLNVYKPSLEPSKVKGTASKMGWRGEEAEADGEPPGTIPEMTPEFRDVLTEYFAPYDAALRAYMGPGPTMELMINWLTSKAAGLKKKHVGKKKVKLTG